jgi:ParB/RepB/Spo0J family partition protein
MAGKNKNREAMLSRFEDIHNKFGNIATEHPIDKIQPSEEIRVVPVDVTLIDRDPNQPRQVFDEEFLSDLGNSIKTHKLQQPIRLVRTDGGRYRLVFGECRWRASILAGLPTIDSIICDKVEHVAELQLIENLKRKDLHPVEESLHIKRLYDSGEYATQEDLAVVVEKSSSSYISRAIGIADFAHQYGDIKGLVTMKRANGKPLTREHFIAIAETHPFEQAVALLTDIINNGMSVRNIRDTKSSNAGNTRTADPVKLFRRDLSLIGKLATSFASCDLLTLPIDKGRAVAELDDAETKLMTCLSWVRKGKSVLLNKTQESLKPEN